MKPIKQVIVIRKDLKMRRGKEIAQGAHASMAFLTKRMKQYLKKQSEIIKPLLYKEFENCHIPITEAEQEWINNSFRKICVTVETATELYELHRLATEAGLESHIITDNGITEFKHIHTVTALAIGPDYDEKIDTITGHLTLY